jgi:riboflavin synthase alpha subunit
MMDNETYRYLRTPALKKHAEWTVRRTHAANFLETRLVDGHSLTIASVHNTFGVFVRRQVAWMTNVQAKALGIRTMSLNSRAHSG